MIRKVCDKFQERDIALTKEMENGVHGEYHRRLMTLPSDDIIHHRVWAALYHSGNPRT